MTKIYEYKLTAIKSDTNYIKKKITTSDESVSYLRQFFKDDILIYESFFILLLNRANYTIGWVKISQGGIIGTVVDIKLLMKYVIDLLASGVILCHNHPSGSITPSEQDKDLTKKIQETLKLIDSKVLDHIILTEDSYFSFADQGLL